MIRGICKKILKIIKVICAVSIAGGFAAVIMDVVHGKKAKHMISENFVNRQKKGASEEPVKIQTVESKKLCPKRNGIYEKYIKRFFDVFLSGLALVILSPIYLGVVLLVRVKLGSPVIFKQERPGKIDAGTGKEKIFCLYKFRSMTDERDENGVLLPDSVRLTKFGKWLRSTSLDELPELVNIIKGDMSIVGPRPQLVRDMVFMTKEQRRRHLVRPGLTGLAQVNGRNAISWEDKLKWDLKYIEKITLFADFKIIIQTVMTALIKKEGITEDDMATAEDFGDYLLRAGKINYDEYKNKIKRANSILNAVEELQQ